MVSFCFQCHRWFLFPIPRPINFYPLFFVIGCLLRTYSCFYASLHYAHLKFSAPLPSLGCRATHGLIQLQLNASTAPRKVRTGLAVFENRISRNLLLRQCKLCDFTTMESNRRLCCRTPIVFTLCRCCTLYPYYMFRFDANALYTFPRCVGKLTW